MIRIRPAGLVDAEPLAACYHANRAFLEPWDPARDEVFYTPEGQRDRLAGMIADPGAYACLIDLDGDLVGTITLTGIVRGPAQSANLGYWVAESANGRGVATEATRQMLDVAFGDLALHRIQAGTLLHNGGSQKVLERNGFERIGIARSYLNIAGSWQDMMLFQRVTDRAGR